MRGFQKLDDLTEENLIFRLLKSESNPVERGYMKYFNNSTSDDTYDDETKSKINDIRLILSLGIGNRLGNIITKKYRKEIKEEHYEIERKQNLSDNEKEKIYYHLVKFANTLDKKEEYKHRDHDDEDYFVIKELENLFGDVDNDDFYNPVLDRSSFEKIMNIIKAKEIKRKKRSVKEYRYVILPHLVDLINGKKNTGNEWKIQINMGVNVISCNDTGEIRTFYVHSDNEEIRSGNETDETITKFLKS